MLTGLQQRPGDGAQLAANLDDLSARIFTKAGELKASLPSLTARQGIADLVRQMNSYYSNLIEGHKTLPKDIEQAMKSGTTGSEDDQRNQRMSIAHIKVEQAMRTWLRESPMLKVFSSAFIKQLHREFYTHLPALDLQVASSSGRLYPLVPGEFRNYQVSVGLHEPPDHTALQGFMQRFEQVYGASDILTTQKLIALAAAHHRLVWIHPFGDGNGRVTRLQSQAAMIQAGIDGEGLWTLSRGLARTKEMFHQFLQAADQQRLNDRDGRGNLSEQRLGEFCHYFLTTILDQMQFMVELIKPATLTQRIAAYVAIELIGLDARMKSRLTRLLCELCYRDELARGEVPGLLGVKGTTARDVIRTASELELVTSASEKRPLHLHFPTKVAEIYFPGLFANLAAT